MVHPTECLKPVFWSMTANAASVSPSRRALSDWKLTRILHQYGWFRIKAKRPNRLWGRAIDQVVPNAAFLVSPNWEIARGLGAFLALLPWAPGWSGPLSPLEASIG